MSLLPSTPLTDGVITLRPWTDADIPWIVQCFRDPEVPRWTRLQPDFDEAKAEAWLVRVSNFTERLWLAVVDAKTGEPRGSVGIHRCGVPPPYESDDCLPDELGYVVAKEARSMGVATRSAALLMDYAFTVLRRPSLHMTIKVGNEPSLRIAKKLHFKTFSNVVASCGSSPPADIVMFKREAPHQLRVPRDGLTDGVIRLREWRDSDNSWLIECMRDPEISKWTRIPYPYTEEHAKLFSSLRAEWRRTGHHVVLAIEEAKSGHQLGCVGLHRIDLPPPYEQADFLPNELGYYLSKDARQKGYATRASQLLCEFAFAEFKLSEINMGIKAANGASVRLAQRLGFVEIGRDRKAIGSGPVEDVVLLRRVRKDK